MVENSRSRFVVPPGHLLAVGLANRLSPGADRARFEYCISFREHVLDVKRDDMTKT